MKRPLLVVAIGYIIGIVWGLYCNCSIALLYALFFATYVLKKLFHKKRKRFKLFSVKRYFRYIKLFFDFNVVFVILVISVISNFVVINQNKKYNSLYNNINEVTLKGIITSNKTEKESINVYTLRVEELNGSKRFKNTNLLIRIRKGIDIEYGDKLEIKGQYINPNSQRNYKGFDYKEFLKTKKIYGIVKTTNVKVIEKDCNLAIFSFSNKMFLRIKNNIRNVLPQNLSSLTLGIMLGYTDDITEDVKEQITNSNMAHILAVSGLHITYITLSSMFVLKPVFGKRLSKIIVFLIINLYMLITGFSPSVVRTTIMQSILQTSGVFYRKNDVWTSIAISSLIILIYNPYLLTSISFLLSYGGVIGIITLNKTVLYLLKKIKINNKKYKYKINKKNAKIIKFTRESFAMAISVNLIITPILIMYYNSFSLSFLLTNLFVSILIGPIIAIGIIIIISAMISVNVLRVVSIFYSPLIYILNTVSRIVGKLPLSKIYICLPNLVEILAYYFFIYLQNFIFKIYMSKKVTSFEFRVRNILSLIRYKIKKNMGRVIFSILLFITLFVIIKTIPQDLKINFIDVGQGDSTLIITPMKKSILIDGGGSTSEDFDIGKSILVPYLLSRKINHIDYIIISHFDQDHVGGLLTVMEELNVKKVIIAKQNENSENFDKFKEIVKMKKINIVVVKQGDKIKIENNIFLDVLWPSISYTSFQGDLNDGSLVCKLRYKAFSMLFTGDIEETAETQILKQYKANNEILKAEILKVAHHGSKTSSMKKFIDAVKPKIALIGVGENNLFGHPNKEVIDRLEAVKSQIYRTDKMGEISINIDKNGKIKRITTRI